VQRIRPSDDKNVLSLVSSVTNCIRVAAITAKQNDRVDIVLRGNGSDNRANIAVDPRFIFARQAVANDQAVEVDEPSRATVQVVKRGQVWAVRVRIRHDHVSGKQFVAAKLSAYFLVIQTKIAVSSAQKNIRVVAQHFCATCNRVRLTVDGQMHLYLGQEERTEFRALLRGGASDEDLAGALRQALELKLERHEFGERPAKLSHFMNMTGG